MNGESDHSWVDEAKHGEIKDANQNTGCGGQAKMNGETAHDMQRTTETDTTLTPSDPPVPNGCDDLVSCPVCQGPCVHPRLLPCYHTVCSSCLDSHITSQVSTDANNNTFPCPLCSCPTKLPQPLNNRLDHTNYAQRFEPDAFVEKLANVLSAFKDSKSCDLCRRRDISQAAGNWCLECLDAMCESCLKVHLSGKTTQGHSVVSLEELQKLPVSSVMRRGLAQSCRTHTGETVRFYCIDCNTTVCVQCLTISHRKCEQCLPLDDAMTSMGGAVSDVMVRMQAVTSAKSGYEGGESDVTFYQSGAQVLEESVKEAEEKIRSLASDLRQAITDREQELLERLHSVASQLHEKVGDFRHVPRPKEDDVRTLKSAHARLEALVKYGSDVEVLEMLQAVQAPLSRLEGGDADTSGGGEDEVHLTVKFSPESLVQAFRRDFQALGEISVQDSSSDDGLASWGVAVTEKDDIIVVDCRNRRVQKFGISGDLLDHIQVSNEPRDVTSCGRSQNLKLRGGEGEEEVAVLLQGKQVYIITVSAKMALKRRFKTSRQYDSISFSQTSSPNPGSTKTSASGIFLVSSLEERCVDVINPEGDVIKTLGGADPGSGTPLFLTPRYVAVTREGHFAVSDSGQNCVVCFTENGGAEFRYAPEGSHAVVSPQGVCGDKFGNLFLADYGNSRVHMVAPDGSFARFVLGPDSGLRRPVAVAMTPRSSKLVLVQSDGVVKVFSYTDTKAKMKVPCWCPRCSTSTDDGDAEGEGQDKQGQGRTQTQVNFGYQGRLNGRSRTSSLASSGSGSGGGGSRGSRPGSESYSPLSPTSPVFHTPHLNGRARKY